MRPPRPADAPDLIGEGYEALDRGDWHSALRIAARLRRIRNSGNFEIGARALWALGRRDQAIKLLKEGVRLAPSVYVLWEYLGHYLSDCGHYEEAAKAFEMCRDTGGDYLGCDINIAIVRQREDRYLDSLSILDAADLTHATPEHRLTMEDIRLSGLNQLARFDEALAIVANLEVPPDSHLRNRFLLSEAYARLKGRGEVEEAIRLASEAYRRDRTNEYAQWLLREATNRRPAAARGYVVKVVVRPPDGGPFTAKYTVVAESAAQALELVTEFERPEDRSWFSKMRVRTKDPAEDVPLGIYHVEGWPDSVGGPRHNSLSEV